MANPKKKSKYKVNIRLDLPPNRVHKSKKDYDRKRQKQLEEAYERDKNDWQDEWAISENSYRGADW